MFLTTPPHDTKVMTKKIIGSVAVCVTLALAVSSVPTSAADVLQFRKVDYFEVVTLDDGEMKERKHDARLEIDTVRRTMAIVHERRGAAEATYASFPFDAVTSVLYERSKSPRIKSAIFLSPFFLFSPGKKHWLTIEFEGGYAYMRLDKKNQGQIRAALSSVGFEVETLIED